MHGSGLKLKFALLLLLSAGVAYTIYRVEDHYAYRRALQEVDAANERRDFKLAGILLEKCIDSRPDDPLLHLLAARAARRRGDFPTARRELTAFAKLHGSENERRPEQQLLDIQQGIDRAGAESLIESCLKEAGKDEIYLALEVAIAYEAAKLESAYALGISLLEGPAGIVREKTEKAIAQWLRIRTGPADRAQGLAWRGRVQALIDPQAAVDDFRAALDLDPEHFDARVRLAAALADYNPREAAAHLEFLRSREPQNKQVCLLLANFRRSLGQIPEAEQLLDDMLALSPIDSALLLERGKTALDAGRIDESIVFLQKALAVAPDDPAIHLALSRSLHLGRKEEAALVHQRRYNEIESERTRLEQIRSEETRAAWRKRVELGLLGKESAPKP